MAGKLLKAEVGDAVWKLIEGVSGINFKGRMLRAEATQMSPLKVKVRVWPETGPVRTFVITVTEPL